MIHKYLIVSKLVYLSSTKISSEQGSLACIELLLPLPAFWKLSTLIGEAEYLLASKEQPADIQAVYKSIFKVAGPYAKSEPDRVWLYQRLQTG